MALIEQWNLAENFKANAPAKTLSAHDGSFRSRISMQSSSLTDNAAHGLQHVRLVLQKCGPAAQAAFGDIRKPCATTHIATNWVLGRLGHPPRRPYAKCDRRVRPSARSHYDGEVVAAGIFSEPSLRWPALWLRRAPNIGVGSKTSREQLRQQHQLCTLPGGLLDPILSARQIFSYATILTDDLNRCNAN